MLMKLPPVLFFLMLIGLSAGSQGIGPVGTWTAHFSYRNSLQVLSTPDKIISTTPFAITIVNLTENEISTLSKVNGLTETGITAIGYNSATNNLLVGYLNGNIDLVTESRIINIADLKRSGQYAGKRINHIYSHRRNAYLSTEFGIIVLDLDKKEIRETYIPGSGGLPAEVRSVTVFNDRIYAAIGNNIYTALLSSGNLQDYRSWSPVSPAFMNPVDQLISDEAIMIANSGGTVFKWSGSDWLPVYQSVDSVIKINLSANKILVSENIDQIPRIRILSLDGTTENSFSDPRFLKAPSDFLLRDESIWIADSINGLLENTGSGSKYFLPEGPPFTPAGEMTEANDLMYFTAGAIDALGNPVGLAAGMASLSKGSWSNLIPANADLLEDVNDLLPLAYDFSNGYLYSGSASDGLTLRKNDGEFTLYREGSFIEADQASALQYRVTGLATDQTSTLWITNHGAAAPLIARKPDGTVFKFSPSFPLNGNAVSRIIIDDADQKWIISPGNGLLCFNHGQSIENNSDDQWRYLRTGAGNGNLPSSDIFSIASDLNGFIWIGTSRGIAIIPCPEQIFTSQGCEAILPVVQQGNFAGLLFADQQVRTIAVDGANRKWVGTDNGVWLISADGEKIISRFTEINSPLPSDSVRQIFVHSKTGEVFFITSHGLVSYRGTATSASPNGAELLVFPNPVPPGYNGSISIRGLFENAVVKITELNGRLVYQTRALGGQAIWNGLDYKGRAVASGVYLVFVTNDGRTENLATKIVFIRK